MNPLNRFFELISTANPLSPLPDWLKGRKGVWALAAGIYTVVYSFWIIFKWTDPSLEPLIAGLGYLPLGLFSAINSIFVSYQKHLEHSVRRAWQWIALGFASLAIGDIIYVFKELTVGIGFPDLPDFFYLLFYPFIFLGLSTLPTHLSDPSQKKTWGVDLTIMIASGTGILWYFIIAPTALAGGADWASRLVSGAYPAMDVLILTIITSQLFRKTEANIRQSLYLLGIAMLVYIAADIIYAWQLLQDIYISGSLADLLWTLTYFLVGLGALRQVNPDPMGNISREETRINWQASLLPFAAVIASAGSVLYVANTGFETGLRTGGLILGTTIAIFATIARQVITVRENSRLVDELNTASNHLRLNASALEERVRERTQKLEGQTKKLHLAARIARDISAANRMENLLSVSASLISSSFELLHTGIYLLDNKREFLVLVASGSETNPPLLAEKIRFHLGEDNIISRVAATQEAVFAPPPDSAGKQKNDLAQGTQPRIVLPLKVEQMIIGVLDIQSVNPYPFDEDDVAVMQVIADHIAIAIERMRLIEKSANSLEELERSYDRYTREGWNKFRAGSQLLHRGYRFNNIRIEPVEEVPEVGRQALEKGSTVSNPQSQPNHEVAIPIKFRGQTIGVVHAKLREGAGDTVLSTLEQAIDRLASSLESARLYEETQLRANREQAISQIAGLIGSSSDYETILRTTVREIGNVINDSEVLIQIAGNLGDER